MASNLKCQCERKIYASKLNYEFVVRNCFLKTSMIKVINFDVNVFTCYTVLHNPVLAK